MMDGEDQRSLLMTVHGMMTKEGHFHLATVLWGEGENHEEAGEGEEEGDNTYF